MAKLRQLFVLKALTSLLVLDLTFNPVTAAETYRLFVIFHFHSLKALDGCTVVSVSALVRVCSLYYSVFLHYSVIILLIRMS